MLTATAVNSYLKQRLSQVSPKTAANERGMLLILWRWAYDQQLVSTYPRGVLKIKVPGKPVRAWSVSDCCTAVNHAIAKRGRRMRNGADIGRVLECWLMLGYATGARWSDLWAMTRKHLDGHVLRYTQNKTGNAITAILPENCLDAVHYMLLRSPDDRIIGWVCQKRWAMRMMQRHLRECGLSGSSKWLRRSAATHIEMQSPGKARVFLGHKTPTMVRHYLDMGQLMADVPQAPQLVLAGK